MLRDKKQTNMRFLLRLLSLIYISVLFSCTPLRYTPRVTLSPCEETINRKIEVKKFIDLSPLKDKKAKIDKYTITSDLSLSDSLDNLITNAIVSDFSENNLFAQVGRDVYEPDFILKGEVRKFSGLQTDSGFSATIGILSIGTVIAGGIIDAPVAVLAALGIVFVPYLGFTLGKHTSDVEIVVRVYDKNNNLIGEYEGKSSNSQKYSAYKNFKVTDLHRLLNEDFSKAIEQIRNQIIKDKDLFAK